MKYVLMFWLIVFIFQIYPSFNKRCGTSFTKSKDNLYVKADTRPIKDIQVAPYEGIRIFFDFSGVTEKYSPLLNDLKIILNKTKQVFEKIIKVKRLTHKLKLNESKCSDAKIPSVYKNQGVDADLIIFVVINTDGSFAKDKTEAAAIYCIQDSTTKRPVAGYIEYSPEIKLKDSSTMLDYFVWLSLHEITHVFVMHMGLYYDFVDANYRELNKDHVLGKKRVSKRGKSKTVNLIKTPKVVEKAREHFKCPDLEGVPLESTGDASTAGCHWSKKYMNTDYMIGDSYGENLISEITLALIEDSGWYEVDYSMANLFLWGKDKGCGFFSEKCIVPFANENNSLDKGYTPRFSPEFCAKLNYPTCSRSNIFRAQCVANYYSSPLPANERYFQDPKIGGSDDMTQKCPIATDENLFDTGYYESSCRVGKKIISTSQLEKICPECSCFMSTLNFKGVKREYKKRTHSSKKFRFKSISGLDKEKVINDIKTFNGVFEEDPKLNDKIPIASCYEYKCEEDELFVIIENIKYKCPKNSVMEFKDPYTGYIICPDSDEICNKKYRCKFGCTEDYNNKGYTQIIKSSEVNIAQSDVYFSSTVNITGSHRRKGRSKNLYEKLRKKRSSKHKHEGVRHFH